MRKDLIIVAGVGIPLEIRINPSLDYTKIILKNKKRIEGYDEFSKDHFGNLIQIRYLDKVDFSLLKSELERLCST